MTTYSIKEISKAWCKFNSPKYLVKEDVICYESNVEKLPIDYSQWIAYLISEEWKKK